MNLIVNLISLLLVDVFARSAPLVENHTKRPLNLRPRALNRNSLSIISSRRPLSPGQVLRRRPFRKGPISSERIAVVAVSPQERQILAKREGRFLPQRPVAIKDVDARKSLKKKYGIEVQNQNIFYVVHKAYNKMRYAY